MNKKLSALMLVGASVVAAPALSNENCNPLSVGTCGVPFPSDYWTEQDSSSLTGRTVKLPDEALRPEVLAQLPVEAGFSPERLFRDNSGFSAAMPIVFEFENRPTLDEVTEYGEGQVVAYDLTAGKPIEVRSTPSAYARGKIVSAPSEVVEVYPVVRWPFGHQVVVAVTKGMPIPGETKDFDSMTSGLSGKQAMYAAELADALAQAGVATSQVRNATMFTVRDQSEVVGPVQEIVDRTWEREHPIRNMEVHYQGYEDNKLAIITGQFRTDNYRAGDEPGGMVDFNREPTEQWLRFRLTIPKASRTQGKVPIAFYAHGLGLNKNTDIINSGMNADLGIATFSVNFPNHGARSEDDGGMLFTLLQTESLPTVIGMLTQNIFDFTSAHKALLSLAELDVVATKPDGLFGWIFGCWKCEDGIPDLDTSRVFMQGTSLGGVLGSSYAALSPDIDAALYHVAGVGITGILAGSILWDVMFANLEPSEATGAEALLLKGAVQQAMDYGDSINYIELLRNPRNGPPRPMMIISGKDDGIVPNPGTIAMARLVDLPIVGKEWYDMPGVRREADFDAEGWGVIQYPQIVYPLEFLLGSLLTDATGHFAFLWPKARADQRGWMNRFIVQD